MTRPISAILHAAALSVCVTCAAFAQQNLFQTAIRVNDAAITNYEINQRVLFLRALNSGGDVTARAREDLIDDRLRVQAGNAAGVDIGEDAVVAGINEFAGRVQLSGPEFIARLGQAGVAEQTFRDFVSSGLIWREVVQTRFGPQARPTDAEIDSALSVVSTGGDVRFLLSEIILPLAPQIEAESRALIERLSRTLKSQPAFSAAAREYSAAPTRDRGGRLDWLPSGRLPPPLRAEILSLPIGGVTEPFDLGPGIAIFQLRALEEIEGAEPETLALEYVLIALSTPDQADALDANYDTCDDLYAAPLTEGALRRETRATADVPRDLALKLALLDANETVSDGVQYLKLCGRTLDGVQSTAAAAIPTTTTDAATQDRPTDPNADADVDPDADDGRANDTAATEDTPARNTDETNVDLPDNIAGDAPADPATDRRQATAQRLFQQRLTSYGEGYLEELRADAIIVTQ